MTVQSEQLGNSYVERMVKSMDAADNEALARTRKELFLAQAESIAGRLRSSDFGHTLPTEQAIRHLYNKEFGGTDNALALAGARRDLATLRIERGIMITTALQNVDLSASSSASVASQCNDVGLVRPASMMEPPHSKAYSQVILCFATRIVCCFEYL